MQQLWEKKARDSTAQQQSAASRASASKLSVMDVVEIADSEALARKGRERGEGGERKPKRAMVLKTQGVPGLNKISVRSDRFLVGYLGR